MLQHLKLNCNRLGEILKIKRGDQYNFGFNEDSPLLVTMNMTESMLDDPDASYTKSIINYFGNIDRLRVNTETQGFDKFTDDLILK